jgi:hypothetical protein
MAERKVTDMVSPGQEIDEKSIAMEMPMISVPERGLAIDTELAEIERNIEFFKKVQQIALKLTRPEDWVDMGSSPYLMDRGAEKIGIAFGVDISDVKLSMEWNEDEQGRYYTFIASGKAYSKKLGRYVEDIGVCSQRDKFFGLANGKLLPMANVDMANIRRKAVTNLYSRLIKRVTGLMGVTWEDLERAGITKEATQKVDFKSGKKKVEANLSPGALEKRSEIWRICLELSNANEAEAKKILAKISSFKDKDGKEHHIDDIANLTSEKWIEKIYARAMKLYEDETKGYEEEGQ